MYDKENNYRYRLETYDPKVRKHICPACEKRTFVRYIDTATGEYVSTDVGKCDRLEKCGYHKTPRDFFNEHGKPNTKDYFFPKKTVNTARAPDTFSKVSAEFAADTMRGFLANNLYLYMLKQFGWEATERAFSLYHVGTCKYWRGATVFWQIDSEYRHRTGKIMLYDRITGHRVKDPVSKIMWVHKLQMFRDFKLRQCLFGEHLLKGTDAPVAIVESEKTAIFASIFFPGTIWLATGGLENLREETTRCLMGRRIYLFPDLGAEAKWVKKANSIPALRTAIVSTWLSENSTNAEKAQGLDIGDWLVAADRGWNLKVEDYL